MAEFLSSFSLFPLVLTIGAYQFGLWCQKKFKTSLCNPIMIAVLVVLGVLLLFRIPNDTYQQGISAISWLLTPATTCFALPLYNQLKLLKKNLSAILLGVFAGSVTSLFFVLLLCKLFSVNDPLTVSLLPKSITSAIGIVISEENGGFAALTAVTIVFTGIFGGLIGSALCKLLKIEDPISQGVAFGTAAHIGGTARASELGSLQGAVSSLSLVVAGILTAILMPFFLSLI